MYKLFMNCLVMENAGFPIENNVSGTLMAK